MRVGAQGSPLVTSLKCPFYFFLIRTHTHLCVCERECVYNLYTHSHTHLCTSLQNVFSQCVLYNLYTHSHTHVCTYVCIHRRAEAGEHGRAGWPNTCYGVSKAALNALTRIQARDLAGRQILVNSCCPGWCATDMSSNSGH